MKIKTYFAILKYDIINGILKEYKKYIVLFVMFFVFCTDFFIRYGQKYEQLNERISFGDLLFFIFVGTKAYIIGENTTFHFPSMWLLYLMIIFYIVLYYPFNDLSGSGKSVLINARSRILFWLSKCSWVIISLIACFIVIWTACLIFSLFFGFSINCQVSEISYGIFLYDAAEFTIPQNINLQILLLPLTSVISIGLLQAFVSLISKPIYSFLLTISILVASSYYMNYILLGNYIMIQRSADIVAGGVSVISGLLYPFGLSMIVIFAGIQYFMKKDIF